MSADPAINHQGTAMSVVGNSVTEFCMAALQLAPLLDRAKSLTVNSHRLGV